MKKKKIIIFVKKSILGLIFSQYEVNLIHDALNDKSDRFKLTLNESCQDAVYDIKKIKDVLPKEGRHVFD